MESNWANTEAWKAVTRWHIGNGTSAQKGDGVGVVRAN
jgi:hypothetical protein